MKQSKLYHFFHQLSDVECKAFLKYLASPLYNRKPELLHLAEILVQKLPKRKHKNLTEVDAFAFLFPGKPFNQNRFRKLKSELLEHLHGFNALQVFRQDKPQNHLYRLQQLNAQQENRFFSQACQLALEAIEPHADEIQSLESKRLVLMERYIFEVRQPQRRPPETLAEAHQLLQYYHAARQVRLAYLSTNQANVTGQPTAVPLEAGVRGLFEERFEEFPAEAQGYWLLLACIDAPEEKPPYQRLKTFLDFGDKTPPAWSKDLITGSLNHASRLYNSGNDAFLEEIFQWYLRALAEGILLENGRLLAAHLKNVVSVAAKLGHHHWATELVKLYADRIIGDHQQNARIYNEGVVALYKADYSIAISRFDQVLADYQDHFYGLDARVLMLQACYLAQELQLAESMCHASRMFFRRNTHLNSERKQRYLSFVKYFLRMLECPPHDELRLQKLRHAVFQKATMPAKKWLLQQLDLLLATPPH